MKNSRALLVLFILGAGFSLYYLWQNMPHEEHVHALLQSEAKAGTGNGRDAKQQFDFSGGSHLKFSQPKINLFRQLFPPPPVKQTPKIIVAPVVPPAPVVIVQAPPPPVPVQNVSSPMPGFRVLGFLQKGGELTAFVSLQGKIYLLKKNQQFAGEFRVTELDSQQITIGRLNGAGEVKIPLTEAKVRNVFSSGRNSRTVGRSTMRVVRPVPVETSPFLLPTTPETEPSSSGVEPPSSGVEPPSPGVEPPSPGVEPPSPGVEPPSPGVEPPSPGVGAN